MTTRPTRGSSRGRAGDSPSSARRGRRQRSAGGGHEEGGAERWLVTYADVLTLLLVLFIVLFSISVVNTSKFISLRSSLSSAFGDGQKSVLDGGNGLNENDAQAQGQQLVMPGAPVLGAKADASSTAAPNQPAAAVRPRYPAEVEREVHNFAAIRRSITAALTRQGLTGAVRFTVDRRGLIVTIVTNSLVFPGNSADLLPGGSGSSPPSRRRCATSPTASRWTATPTRSR